MWFWIKKVGWTLVFFSVAIMLSLPPIVIVQDGLRWSIPNAVACGASFIFCPINLRYFWIVPVRR